MQPNNLTTTTIQKGAQLLHLQRDTSRPWASKSRKAWKDREVGSKASWYVWERKSTSLFVQNHSKNTLLILDIWNSLVIGCGGHVQKQNQSLDKHFSNSYFSESILWFNVYDRKPQTNGYNMETIGIPQNGWFITGNPIKMGWFGGTPIFGNIHIITYIYIYILRQWEFRGAQKHQYFLPLWIIIRSQIQAQYSPTKSLLSRKRACKMNQRIQWLQGGTWRSLRLMRQCWNLSQFFYLQTNSSPKPRGDSQHEARTKTKATCRQLCQGVSMFNQS